MFFKYIIFSINIWHATKLFHHELFVIMKIIKGIQISIVCSHCPFLLLKQYTIYIKNIFKDRLKQLSFQMFFAFVNNCEFKDHLSGELSLHKRCILRQWTVGESQFFSTKTTNHRLPLSEGRSE